MRFIDFSLTLKENVLNSIILFVALLLILSVIVYISIKKGVIKEGRTTIKRVLLFGAVLMILLISFIVALLLL